MNWLMLKMLIIENLTNDLLDPAHRKMKEANPNLALTFGHCYVASETAYYMLGGKERGWTPQHIKHVGRSHWYLKHESGFILDLTGQQFRTPLDYSEGRGKGFMTKGPCKRTQKLLDRIVGSKRFNLIKSSGH
jgi:hypothetical protein